MHSFVNASFRQRILSSTHPWPGVSYRHSWQDFCQGIHCGKTFRTGILSYRHQWQGINGKATTARHLFRTGIHGKALRSILQRILTIGIHSKAFGQRILLSTHLFVNASFRQCILSSTHLWRGVSYRHPRQCISYRHPFVRQGIHGKAFTSRHLRQGIM